jgi:hypothetical protein
MIAALVMTMLASTAGKVRAQGGTERQGYLTIDFGAQPQQRTVAASTSFQLYEETATVNTSRPVHNGPVFGAGGGYRVRPQFGIGAAFTMFNSRSTDASVLARIPDPIFFDRPKTVSATAADLEHKELGIHVQAAWFRPVTDALEIVLSAGPSIINVKHDVATATVATGTQNVTIKTASQSKTGIGFNAGFEGNYLFQPQLGVGLFVRYAGGKVDLPDVPDLTIGGLQAGLGLRVRF